jgi:transposase
VVSSGRPIAQIADELGIKARDAAYLRPSGQADRGQRTNLLPTDKREELKPLRKGLAELRRANEILKVGAGPADPWSVLARCWRSWSPAPLPGTA